MTWLPWLGTLSVALSLGVGVVAAWAMVGPLFRPPKPEKWRSLEAERELREKVAVYIEHLRSQPEAHRTAGDGHREHETIAHSGS